MEYNANGRQPADGVYDTGTWNKGGTAPCAASVSNGGFLSVTDANAKLLYSQPSPSARAAPAIAPLVTPTYPVASEPALLAASLRTATGGAPIAGATLLVDPGNGSALRRAVTDATGQASVEHWYHSLDLFNAIFTFDGAALPHTLPACCRACRLSLAALGACEHAGSTSLP